MVACRRPKSLLVATLALSSLVAAACGGGGGGAANVKAAAAAVTATFPAAHCVTDAQRMTVRGTASDPKRIQSIEVGGVPASSRDKFANWDARVAIKSGTTSLSVVPFDRTGAQLPPVDLVVDVETLPSSPVRASLDPKRKQVLVGEDRLQPFGALALDLAEGRWISVSGPNRGTGPEIDQYSGFVVDAAMDVAYGFTTSPFQVVRIDLAKGDRQVISDSTSAGPVFSFSTDIDLDSANARLLFPVPTNDALFAVSLVDGSRSVFSDDTHGTGPAFSEPAAVMVLAAQGRALVVDELLGALFSVDLATGDRSIVSDFSRGSGPFFELPRGVAFDPATGDALVLSVGSDVLMRVDLITGDRAVVTDATHGGAKFESLSYVAHQLDASGRALVVDQSAARILAVDLASGVREDMGRVHVGEATPLGSVHSFDVDPENGRLLVMKRSPVAALLEVDPVTGRRTLISSADRGSGPMFTFGFAVAFSSARRTFFVGDSIQVFAIDAATGDRRILEGSELGGCAGLELDVERDALLILDDAGADTSLFSIDLATGERSEVSGPNRGNGERFFCSEGLALDPDGLTAYVVDGCASALLRIDRVSGDREVVTSPAIGGGPPFQRLQSGLALDPDGRHAYMSDFELGLVEVDLVTGDRKIVSGPTVGSGPLAADTGQLDPVRGRFFSRPVNTVSILAIDLESGDRVMISY